MRGVEHEVWKQTGEGWFMFKAGSNKQWFIHDREHMEAGTNAGWLCVDSTALMPDKITEGWKVWDGAKHVDAPKVRARLA
jgi:hypothetical protein